MVDVNVHLSHWPTRRTRLDETSKLANKLMSHGVVEAWAGSFDGILHKDIRAVNERLVEECQLQGDVRLLPFGSINPMLPGWEEDLVHCADVHRMEGIRLNPNYHGYKLDDPMFARLLELSSHKRLIVTIALVMEDERIMHPLLRVPPVDPSPLAEIVSRISGLRLVLLNAMPVRSFRGEKLRTLLKSGEVYVDIAMLEGMGGTARLLGEIPMNRVLFGSNAPAFYFESAKLKLQESDLTESALLAIQIENARRLLPLK